MEVAEDFKARLVQRRWTTDEFGKEGSSIALSDGTKILDQHGRVLLSDNVDIRSAGLHHAAIMVERKPENPANSAFYFVYEKKGRLRLAVDRILELFGVDTRQRRY